MAAHQESSSKVRTQRGYLMRILVLATSLLVVVRTFSGDLYVAIAVLASAGAIFVCEMAPGLTTPLVRYAVRLPLLLGAIIPLWAAADALLALLQGRGGVLPLVVSLLAAAVYGASILMLIRLPARMRDPFVRWLPEHAIPPEAARPAAPRAEPKVRPAPKPSARPAQPERKPTAPAGKSPAPAAGAGGYGSATYGRSGSSTFGGYSPTGKSSPAAPDKKRPFEGDQRSKAPLPAASAAQKSSAEAKGAAGRGSMGSLFRRGGAPAQSEPPKPEPARKPEPPKPAADSAPAIPFRPPGSAPMAGRPAPKPTSPPAGASRVSPPASGSPSPFKATSSPFYDEDMDLFGDDDEDDFMGDLDDDEGGLGASKNARDAYYETMKRIREMRDRQGKGGE